MSLIKLNKNKRGDTFIEVMFALAVFSLVAVLSIAMMNAGIATGERSLELVTARNELNAQAEALRFVHSAYTSELSLPDCNEPGLDPTAKCQRYKGLWQQIIDNAKNPYNPADPNNTSNYSIPSPLTACQDVYNDDNKLLKENNAFILNTRAINHNPTHAYIPATSLSPTNQPIFQPALLNARIIFTENQGEYEEGEENSVDVMTTDPTAYRQVGRAEGIWVVAVKDGVETKPRYYDFYIQTCWYGSGMRAPTTLDTIVRLYNPENVK